MLPHENGYRGLHLRRRDVGAWSRTGHRRLPSFAPSSTTGWIGYGPEYMPVENAPRPVAADPAHPYVPNAIEYLSARPNLKVVEQIDFPGSGSQIPILQPWVRDELNKLNERVLAGQPVFEHRASCWPSGVPAFDSRSSTPCSSCRTQKQVTIISQADHMVRRVHLNVPAIHRSRRHPGSANSSVTTKATRWSFDTIGLNAKHLCRHLSHAHSEQLHVIERFRLIEDGKTLEAEIYVEDPVRVHRPLAWHATFRVERARPVAGGRLRREQRQLFQSRRRPDAGRRASGLLALSSRLHQRRRRNADRAMLYSGSRQCRETMVVSCDSSRPARRSPPLARSANALRSACTLPRRGAALPLESATMRSENLRRFCPQRSSCSAPISVPRSWVGQSEISG